MFQNKKSEIHGTARKIAETERSGLLAFFKNWSHSRELDPRISIHNLRCSDTNSFDTHKHY